MRLGTLGAFVLAAAIARNELAPPTALQPTTQRLLQREEKGRVVLAWSGPIAEPMSRDVAAALASRKDDPRRLVLTLNSPGGSVREGREVVRVLRAAARPRGIDMRVENGGVCASMCVPIYLLGSERTADPAARFMFHEAKVQVPSGPEGDRTGAKVDARARRVTEERVTDILYEQDFDGPRVNARWLWEMRRKIVGRDVWISARQLFDEGSGIVDALSPTPLR